MTFPCCSNETANAETVRVRRAKSCPIRGDDASRPDESESPLDPSDRVLTVPGCLTPGPPWGSSTLL